MARTITIDLRDFAGVAAGETVGGEDHVVVWAPTFRPAVSGAWVVGPQPKAFYFKQGKVKIAGVEPGPITLQFNVRQFTGEDTFKLNVPEGEGEIDLRTLMVEEYEYSPIVLTEAQRVLDQARDVLKQAKDTRESVEETRKNAESALTAIDDKVKSSSDALSEATNAAISNARTSIEQVIEQNKASLNAQVEAVNAAKAGAEAAKDGAEAAKDGAEAAKAEADRAAAAATQIINTVEGNYSPVGHAHAVADVTGLQAALDGKAAKSHSHAVADVTGLQAALDGKAAKSHSHAVADVTGLQAALDGKADAATFKPNTVTVETEKAAKELTGLRKGDVVIVTETGNIYKEV